MADISLMGATFYGVPAVELPTAGGGTSTFYEVDGSQTFTQNGTYDVSALAQAVVNVAGGGGDVYAVNFELTYDETEQIDVVTCNRTPNEILAAAEAGKFLDVQCVFYGELPAIKASGVSVFNGDAGPYINTYFVSFFLEGSTPTENDTISLNRITYDSGYEKWNYAYYGYLLTPAT